MSEAIYDAKIAPKLKKLAAECAKLGMSFVAVVEYAPGQRGRTQMLTRDCGLAMTMAAHCVKTGNNVDGYLIGLKRYCKAKGIDISGSIFLKDDR